MNLLKTIQQARSHIFQGKKENVRNGKKRKELKNRYIAFKDLLHGRKYSQKRCFLRSKAGKFSVFLDE